MQRTSSLRFLISFVATCLWMPPASIAQVGDCTLPNSPRAVINACPELIRSGRFMGKELARLHYVLGRGYQAVHKFELAESHLVEAVRLDASASEHLYWLALVYADTDRYAQAMPLLAKALQLKPGRDVDNYWFLQGYVHANMKNYDLAIASYSEAIAIKKHSYYVLARAVAYLQKNDIANADADLAEFPRLDWKGHVGFRNNLEVWWVRYLKEIQDAGDHANWLMPPLDAYQIFLRE